MRRGSGRRALAGSMAVGALTLGLGACTSDDPLDSSPGPLASPTGWRWESFGDAEVSVPAEWGHSTGDVASALWCISDAAVAVPSVVRPGVEVEAPCPGGAAGEPDPSTVLADGGTFVSMVYAASDRGARLGDEGDRTTRRVGAVLIRVQAPQEQREAILDSVRQISVDAHGCPTSDPISTLPTRRPDASVAVGELDDIRSVTACRYAIPGGRFAEVVEEFAGDEALAAPDGEATGGEASTGGAAEPTGAAGATPSATPSATRSATASATPSAEPTAVASDDPAAAFEGDTEPQVISTVAPLLPTLVPAGFPTLLSSVALDTDDARAAVRGIVDSARGTGPDAADGCADTFLRGTEAIVLRITRASGAAEIYLRYGGCRNSFDDGVAERMLSRAAVAPFVSGANSVPAFGEELARILDDPDAPATSGEPELAPPAN